MNADHKLLGTDLDKIASAVDIGIPSDNAYRAAARAIYEEGGQPGTIDVPIGAAVRSDPSMDDPGCWVNAWVWVPDSVALAHDPLEVLGVPAFVRAAIARRAKREGQVA